MIGLDTNILVRFIMRDDPRQTPRADQVLATLTSRQPGFVSLVVLAELWWVLHRSYRRPATDLQRLFTELLDTDELRIQDEPTVRRALTSLAAGVDFADSLVSELAHDAGCQTTVTFDRRAARHPGMSLLS